MGSGSASTSQITCRGGATLAMPPIGMGMAFLGNLHVSISNQDAIDAIHAGLECGLTYLDTAPLYGLGLSERRLGFALHDVKRDDVLVSTKVGRLLRSNGESKADASGQWVEAPCRKIIYDYSYDGVLRSLEDSLERTGLNHFDIVYCHDIDEASDDPSVLDSHQRSYFGPKGGYSALQALRSSGVVKAIGLGVNSWRTCELHAQETDVDLFLLAGRFTLLEQEALDSFLPLCLKKGMHVVVGGPYNSGILATGAVENAMYNYAPASPQIRERVGKIEAVCTAHNVRLIDAALHFPLRHEAVVSIIPGGANAAQMQANACAFSKPIQEALWQDLMAADLLHPACADAMGLAA